MNSNVPSNPTSGLDSSKPGSVFRTTRWSKFSALRSPMEIDRDYAREFLFRRYWKPCFVFLVRSGCPEEDAKDIVQGFFAHCHTSDFFAKAERRLGTFRSFLIQALKNFQAKDYRKSQAQKRRPKDVVISLDELADPDHGGHQPSVRETPENVFHRVWILELINRALVGLTVEYMTKGKTAHIGILRESLILPILEGSRKPTMRYLAERFGLDGETQARNHLGTAKAAFRRHLEAEIQTYAKSKEEVDDEIADLFRFLGEVHD